MQLLLMSVLLLGGLGLLGAIVLYLTAKKFRVEEDPRIDRIEALLPGANCGACGCNGCHDFAVTCVRRGNLDGGLNCPGAREGAMEEIAAILGVAATAAEKKIAVLRCNGSCQARPLRYEYDGTMSCAVMDAVGVGTRGCSFGCLGCGDCVAACHFGAIRINPDTLLPEIDPEACTGCGQCAGACPRHIIDMSPLGPRGRRVWVACSSHDRGAVARKICTSACIGCGKCASTCPFGAITVSGNLAYIDPALCKTCGKCVPVCPTGAIHTNWVLPKKEASENDKDV